MSFERAKIVLAGKNLLSREEILANLGVALSPLKKDKYFKTAHRIYPKPTDLSPQYQHPSSPLNLHVPNPNRFIPKDVSTINAKID